jgi:hypothetical protein
MGINNVSGNITPGLDIVDGDRARFFVRPLPVTRRYQGCNGNDEYNHDHPAWEIFPRGTDWHKKVVHGKTISKQPLAGILAGLAHG